MNQTVACQIRGKKKKNLTNHRIVSLPFFFRLSFLPERKNIVDLAVEKHLFEVNVLERNASNEILLRSYNALWNIINIYSRGSRSASSRPLRSTIHARIKIRRTATKR